MKITKKRGLNDYTISGLTLGKIDFIHRAVEIMAVKQSLGPVGDEFKLLLDYQKKNNPILKDENIFS